MFLFSHFYREASVYHFGHNHADFWRLLYKKHPKWNTGSSLIGTESFEDQILSLKKCVNLLRRKKHWRTSWHQGKKIIMVEKRKYRKKREISEEKRNIGKKEISEEKGYIGRKRKYRKKKEISEEKRNIGRRKNHWKKKEISEGKLATYLYESWQKEFSNLGDLLHHN